MTLQLLLSCLESSWDAAGVLASCCCQVWLTTSTASTQLCELPRHSASLQALYERTSIGQMPLLMAPAPKMPDPKACQQLRVVHLVAANCGGHNILRHPALSLLHLFNDRPPYGSTHPTWLLMLSMLFYEPRQARLKS